MKRNKPLNEMPTDAKPIPDYPGCWATPDGRMLSTIQSRIQVRRLGSNGIGYAVVTCTRSDGKKIALYPHRVVAQLFVPGDQSLTVNHKDLDKLNNRADNLEWITLSHNARHWRKLKGILKS